jgi:hypothetical protein
MSRVLFVWELGEGLGHLGRFPLLADYLRRHGHEVGFALRDLGAAEPVLGAGDWPLLQAPIALKRRANLPLAANYAELLARVGYADVDTLVGLLRAWRSLFRLWMPDLVVFDHAPTALLASRGLDLGRIVQGTGFSCPEVTAGRPAFPLWAPVPPERPAAWERQLIRNVGAALTRTGMPPMDGLAELLRADATLLCTLPELDFYRPHRPQARYFGPVPSRTSGVAMDWPGGRGPRLFAYLKAAYDHMPALMQVLASIDASVLVYVSGIAPGQAAKWTTGHLRVCSRPIDTAPLLADCDLTICHGGHGTAADALLAAVPLLILPLHVENWINGSCITAAGAGLMAGLDDRPPPFLSLLRRLLSAPSFRRRAGEIAAAHPQQSRERRIAALGDRLLAHL